MGFGRSTGLGTLRPPARLSWYLAPWNTHAPTTSFFANGFANILASTARQTPVETFTAAKANDRRARHVCSSPRWIRPALRRCDYVPGRHGLAHGRMVRCSAKRGAGRERLAAADPRRVLATKSGLRDGRSRTDFGGDRCRACVCGTLKLAVAVLIPPRAVSLRFVTTCRCPRTASQLDLFYDFSSVLRIDDVRVPPATPDRSLRGPGLPCARPCCRSVADKEMAPPAGSLSPPCGAGEEVCVASRNSVDLRG